MALPMVLLPSMDKIQCTRNDNTQPERMTLAIAEKLFVRWKVAKMYYEFFSKIADGAYSRAQMHWIEPIVVYLKSRMAIIEASYRRIRPGGYLHDLLMFGGGTVPDNNKRYTAMFSTWLPGDLKELADQFPEYNVLRDLYHHALPIIKRRAVNMILYFDKEVEKVLDLREKPSAGSEGMESDQCAICLEPFHELVVPWSDAPHKRAVLPCGHGFGAFCIATWLKIGDEHPFCPMCKTVVSETVWRDIATAFRTLV